MQLSIKHILKRIIKAPLSGTLLWARHRIGYLLSKRALPQAFIPTGRPKVLVIGVYVSSVKHLAVDLCAQFDASLHCDVEQHWASLGPKSSEPKLASCTSIVCLDRVPKFELLNRLLKDLNLSQFDYILCTDDDISVQRGFLDTYIALKQKFGFSISQPARSWTSSFDHRFVRRNSKLLGRQTRFVEIGPIFSFDRAIAATLIPFDLSTPMGWGYDFVWPVQVAAQNLTMGIIDATTVDHTIRPRGAIYSSNLAADQGIAYRKNHGGLADADSFVELRQFWR